MKKAGWFPSRPFEFKNAADQSGVFFTCPSVLTSTVTR